MFIREKVTQFTNIWLQKLPSTSFISLVSVALVNFGHTSDVPVPEDRRTLFTRG